MNKTKKRTRIEDIRRAELIHAAHRVFRAEGLTGLTTARICAEAGMSPGILAYYFKGKKDALYEMVRYNNRILLEEIILRLRAATTPWGRITAIVDGNFPAEAYERATANAWLSVCAAASANAEYARLQRFFYRRLRSNLGYSFSPVLSGTRLRDMVLSIGVMIDGLWLRKATGEDVDRDQAVRLILALIESTLSPDESAALRQAIPPKTA